MEGGLRGRGYMYVLCCAVLSHILLKPREKAAKAAKTRIAKNKRITENAVKFLKMILV